jgi:uncharacterized protein YabE (DUF348 family)
MRIDFSTLNLGRAHLLIVGVLLAVLSFGIVNHAGAAANDSAHDGRLVTIHDRGESRVVLTHAQTIGDALKDADIAVVDADTVEPNLDETLVATDYTVNIYRARPVIVVDGAIREKIMTAAQTPDAIAKAADIDLKDEDSATLSASTDIISEGASVILTIDRATEFTLQLYGKASTAYTQAKTVGDMLAEKHITLDPKDTLSIDRNAPITAGLKVAIWRDGVQTTTVEEPVAFPTRQIQDTDQPVGYHKVQTAGTDGKKSVTYQITVRDGQEFSRTVIQSVVLEQPKEQVEVVGAGLPAGSHQDWMAAAGIPASDYGYVEYIVTHEGGWCPFRWQGDAGCSNHNSAPSIGGYGLVQATPGNKMATAGSDWLTNPITQLKWATGYAVGRYGSWQAAYNHWLSSHNW